MDLDLIFIDDLDIKEKRVFIRVDFNVPLDDKGNIKQFILLKEELEQKIGGAL